MDDREILVIEVARRGSTGGNVATVDWNTIRNEVTQLLGRTNVTELDDVPDVTAPSPSNGQVLSWNGSAWVPVDVPSGVTTVQNDPPTDTATARTTLQFYNGLTATAHGSIAGRAIIRPNYGGTGSASLVARSDHTHNNPAPTRATFAPQSYMSSGTRPLGSTSVTLPAGISCVVKAKVNMQMRGADSGACYYQLRLTINGNARTSNGGSTGFWCVQGVPDKTTWEHHLVITGTGAAVTVSADCIYYGGGGFYTDAGEIAVEVSTNR